jgi:glycosyltransferase involved in cell wall biosynthesis
MNILYVSQYFPPEMGAPAARVHELSREWARMGHHVTVLTGFPNHPVGRIRDEYRRRAWRLTIRETVDGVSVVRTMLYPAANRGSLGRMLNYASFCASAIVRGAVLERPDVVIGTSPQLLSAAAGLVLAKRFQCPYVFEVRDLWPESLTAVGAAGEQSALYKALWHVATRLYREADLVVPVTQGFVPAIEAYGPSAPIVVVENGVDTERFRPPQDRTGLRRALGFEGRFVVSYIGTVGMAHGLDTLLESAALLQTRLPAALVLVVGEGAERARLEQLARARGLANVRFAGERPRAEIPDLVGASDACLVMLKQSEVFKTVLPSKLLEFMSCGTPAVVTVDGFARELITEGNAGIYVPAGSAEALADGIVALHGDPQQRAQLGAGGRAFALRRFSRARKAAEYIQALATLAPSAARADAVWRTPRAQALAGHTATSSRREHLC